MIIGDWKLYNHGWLPCVAPHRVPNLEPLESGELFRRGGGYLARYTTDFDRKEPSEWWYVICDTPFDIAQLKAKRRYVVKQGAANFDVRSIDPTEHAEALFAVAEKAFAAYPKKYRPTLDLASFSQDLQTWKDDGCIVYGAFLRDSDTLCGYSMFTVGEEYIGFSVQKTDPQYERQQVNAALVYKALTDFSLHIREGKYICDSARNILHETAFPDYLEKYFGFRKAYCKLHVRYAPKYKGLVRFCYPFRKLFRKLDGIGKIHQLNGVLLMEEIVRGQKHE